MMTAEKCANCGEPIGALEEPHLWKSNIVCGPCIAKLNPTGATPVIAHETPDFSGLISDEERRPSLDYESRERFKSATAPGREAPSAPPCPGCGSRSGMKKRVKGSRLVLICLLLLGGFPGLLYMIFYSGYIYVCPSCGMKRGDAQ